MEVKPTFSEAIPLRSLHLTRKPTSARIKVYLDELSHDPSIGLRHFLEQGCHSNDFGLRSPVIQKTV